jgi:integrase
MSARHLRLVAAVPTAPLAPTADEATEARHVQDALVADFLVARRVMVRSPKVASQASSALNNFLPWAAELGKFVWEIGPGDVDRWALALKNSVRTRTHRLYVGNIALFYDWMVARRGAELLQRFGVVVANPIDRFNRARRMPAEERLVPVPREETIEYFLAYAAAAIAAAPSDVKWLQASRSYALWMVANDAGLRRHELAVLEIDDIDLPGGTIRVVEGKGCKWRILRIQPRLPPTLRWYLDDVRPHFRVQGGGRVLFPSAYLRPFADGSVANLLWEQQVLASLPAEDRFTLHGFRRAYATRLYKHLREEGVRDPLVYVQHQLGHEYLSTTQRYCQLDDDYRAELARQAARALLDRYRRRAGQSVAGDGASRSSEAAGTAHEDRPDNQDCRVNGRHAP